MTANSPTPGGVPGTDPCVDGAGPEQLLDPGRAQDAIEYCYEQGWTDGLPVVPCSDALLKAFLREVDRDPEDVVLAMPHLNRSCTVRLAAINAAMAGCRPDYFPLVLAAWESLRIEGYAGSEPVAEMSRPGEAQPQPGQKRHPVRSRPGARAPEPRGQPP